MEVFGRFSILDDDRGIHGYNQHGGHKSNWTITLDGKEIPQVITADSQDGELLANELDEHGNALVRGSSIARRSLTGHVRVFVSE